MSTLSTEAQPSISPLGVFNPYDLDSRRGIERKLNEWGKIPVVSILTGTARMVYGCVRIIEGIVMMIFFGLAHIFVKDKKENRARIRFSIHEGCGGIINLLKGVSEWFCAGIEFDKGVEYSRGRILPGNRGLTYLWPNSLPRSLFWQSNKD